VIEGDGRLDENSIPEWALAAVREHEGRLAEIGGLRALVTRLVAGDPWCSSYEGLDDDCHFCASVSHGQGVGMQGGKHVYLYLHAPDCPWIVGRKVGSPGVLLGSNGMCWPGEETLSSIRYHRGTP
jgi:hypothetical protein